MSKTAFAQWRSKVGLSQDEAARALFKTTRMIQYWERGKGPDGRKIVPPEDTRMLMWAMAKGLKLEPWPEKEAA
jgi:DNA-binding transcriptional regulator YiaG